MTKRPYVAAYDILDDVDIDTSDLEHPDEKSQRLLNEIPPGMNYQYFTEKMGHPDPVFEWRSKFSDYLRKAHPEEPVKTVLSEPGYRTGPYHWDGRRFHSEELARLQTFPSWFDFPDATTSARTLIGNSVPPRMAESVVGVVVGDEDGVDAGELPSPRRGRTSHQTYRERTEKRLVQEYGGGVLDD